MQAVNLDELENAMIVVDGGIGQAKAWVSRETGMIHLRDDDYMDDEAPLPAEIDSDDRYVPVPGSRELDLGHHLVFRFTDTHLPGDGENVRELFRKKGAYARFSKLLEIRGERDAWHRFREEETRLALEGWCRQHGLPFDDARKDRG
jgi:hypothetical protein